MSRLSEFYGIVIYMYFQDHNPPHFHAIYAEHEALVRIDSGEIIRGRLPKTAPSSSNGVDSMSRISWRTGNAPRSRLR